jgi:PAS domain S-box-containing protein
MPSQRVLLGIGLAVLVIISAASIGVDVKLRSDAAWVDHTLRALNKIADTRLLLTRAESMQRGYALTGDQTLLDDRSASLARIAPAFADLKAAMRDDAAQLQLLEATEVLVKDRMAASDEALRLQLAHDTAALAARRERGEGRSLMTAVNVSFDRLVSGQERLLVLRTSNSVRTGHVLLAIDLAGAVLILLLAAMLVREAKRTNLELEKALGAANLANQSLEAAVEERSKNLIEADQELRLSMAVLRSTFNSMAEAVLVIDPEGEVLLTNPAAERMLRYKPGMNVQGLRAQGRIYHADGITPIRPEEMPTARALRGEQFDELEFVARPISGPARIPTHLVASGRPLRDAAGAISGAALVYHDATASRETERQLREAQKLEAVGKLTGGIAHDFNNMLTVISGMTEALVSSLKPQPDLQAQAKLIDDAAQRCSELVRHLLAFARKQTLQPRDVDLNEAVQDIAKLLRPTLGEQIEVVTALGHNVMATHIDPSQLANAVVNMAINARDAMPSGGKLVLETQNVELNEAYAETHADVQPGRYVMLAVTDSGTGMPVEVQDRAFEPFFTTKEVGKGSGLGLSMVYGFVKQSGGHIDIDSAEGRGTTIKLYLPPASGRTETLASEAPAVSGGHETILVVEDDKMVRNFVIAQLASLGYDTIVAADSREALALVERGAPFDLLFTDMVLPGGMTGRDLAAAIEQRRPGTKVLYTTGYSDSASLHHGRLGESALLLSKPYRKPQLAQMVRQALNDGAAALPANSTTASPAPPRQA